MEFADTITLTHFICLAGLISLACWLLKTSLGRRALADSVPRRNDMPLYLPFVPLFVWFAAVWLTALIAKVLIGDLEGWQGDFLDNSILSVGELATVGVIIFLARAHFARRLKGFGLNVRTVFKDFSAASLNLLTVWPLMMAAITLTMFFGALIWGREYQMQRHQELELITQYSQLPLRMLIVVVAVVVAPLLEELLFRGLFQTAIRSFLSAFRLHQSAWLSILISSGLFSIIHANAGHWPALFVLGMCLGYAYEKSGSLFRPIFIHSIFNAASVTAALSQ